MRFDPHDGIAELDRHLARMKRSAEALDFAFDRHVARNELQAATFRAGPSVIRLLLSRSGAMAIEMRPLPTDAGRAGRGRGGAAAGRGRTISGSRTRPATAPSTTRRAQAAGSVRGAVPRPGRLPYRGQLHQSLFVEKGGRLLTPPLSRGLLPGILRGG